MRIDRAWNEFHAVLSEEPPPLNRTIAGDLLAVDCQGTLDELLDGKHDWYCGFASPSLVVEIVRAFAVFGLNDFLRQRARRFGERDERFAEEFLTLQKIYAEAAAEGCGLAIVIA